MMEQTYQQALALIDQWIQDGVDPLEAAAVLTTAGMSLYRTVLDVESYDKIVDAVSDNRHLVKTLIQSDHNLH